MNNGYVVRELVALIDGDREFLTHYEFGIFTTYDEANKCAIATKNPRCFPQLDALLKDRHQPSN